MQGPMRAFDEHHNIYVGLRYVHEVLAFDLKAY